MGKNGPLLDAVILRTWGAAVLRPYEENLGVGLDHSGYVVVHDVGD
jgi:hypothetical protein